MQTRRQVLIGLSTLPLVAGAVRQALAAVPPDTLETSAGPVAIQPIMHASLVLASADQVFYFDPAKSDFSGQKPATAIFITHAHGDHFVPEALPALAGEDAVLVVTHQVFDLLPEALKPRATALANGDTATVGGVAVEAVPAYNTTADRLQYHPKGVGNGYVMSFGDKKVYVAGDTEDTPEMRALSGIDVAFLPMNLPYTMDEEHAADAVKAFKPKVVYPYHYRGSDTRKFADLVGDAAEVRLRDWYGGA
jgi:L-ascorbate metabolism protein UlaG (beta-lactamase superfamily)